MHQINGKILSLEVEKSSPRMSLRCEWGPRPVTETLAKLNMVS